MTPITVQATVQTTIDKAWELWTKPEHITKWTFASDDWESPYAENDLRIGGKFKTGMSAKDKSAGFDFTGTYTAVNTQSSLGYDIDGGRHVTVTFETVPEGVLVTETFDPETENPEEMQRAGWQAILNNFKKYAEQ